GVVLTAWSCAAVGSQGLREWVSMLNAPSTDFAPEHMGNLRALGIRFGFSVAIVAALIALGSFGVVLWRGALADKFASAILLSLLVSPHTYRYDFALLAIA